MKSIIDSLEEFIKSLLTLSDAAILLAALWAVGFICKRWPIFPNAYIPHVLFAGGGLAYPFLTGGFTVRRLFEGFMVASVAVGFHALAKPILEKLPLPEWVKKLLAPLLGEKGDTAFTPQEKTDGKPPEEKEKP